MVEMARREVLRIALRADAKEARGERGKGDRWV